MYCGIANEAERVAHHFPPVRSLKPIELVVEAHAVERAGKHMLLCPRLARADLQVLAMKTEQSSNLHRSNQQFSHPRWHPPGALLILG